MVSDAGTYDAKKADIIQLKTLQSWWLLTLAEIPYKARQMKISFNEDSKYAPPQRSTVVYGQYDMFLCELVNTYKLTFLDTIGTM